MFYLFTIAVVQDAQPSSVLGMLAAAFGGAVFTWFVGKFFPPATQRNSIEGQPIRVMIDQEMHKEFVSKVEFEKVEKRVDIIERSLHSEIGRVIADGERRKDDITRKISADIGGVHARIDAMSEKIAHAIGELKGEMKGRFSNE